MKPGIAGIVAAMAAVVLFADPSAIHAQRGRGPAKRRPEGAPECRRRPTSPGTGSRSSLKIGDFA